MYFRVWPSRRSRGRPASRSRGLTVSPHSFAPKLRSTAVLRCITPQPHHPAFLLHLIPPPRSTPYVEGSLHGRLYTLTNHRPYPLHAPCSAVPQIRGRACCDAPHAVAPACAHRRKFRTRRTKSETDGLDGGLSCPASGPGTVIEGRVAQE